MKKRLMSILLSFSTVMFCLPFGALYAVAETAPFKGSGTDADPYQISTASDLIQLSELVNDADLAVDYRDKFYKQTNDIDLKQEPFTPIGTKLVGGSTGGFRGHYDGNYKSITNLYVNREEHDDSNYSVGGYNGLFGWTWSGEIKNLSVYGVIDCPKSEYCGGILGQIQGNSIISNCSFSGKVIGVGRVGGIVGSEFIGGTIQNCYANCELVSSKGSSSIVGGILGAATFSSDTLAYQFVLKNNYATGKIGEHKTAGGIIGNTQNQAENQSVTIENNYYLVDMCEKGINGIISTGCTKLSAAALKACADMLGSSFVDNNEEGNFNDGYPIFEWQSSPYQFKGSGTKEDPYQIATKDELAAMRDLINSKVFRSQYRQKQYILTADIDLQNEEWEPIATRMVDGVDDESRFLGTFNGNYHRIDNINIVKGADRFAGLFGSLNGGGVIKNLAVSGSVKSEGNSVGGIVGELCSGGCVVMNCCFYGDVKGSRWVGGIVGDFYQKGSVINCYHNGQVTSSTGESAGGIAGRIAVAVNTDGESLIENCYHVGKIVATNNQGGCIAGTTQYTKPDTYNATIVIRNCFGLNGDAYNNICVNGDIDENSSLVETQSQLRNLAEDLGSAYVSSPASNYNSGYPVFIWQAPMELLNWLLAKPDSALNGLDSWEAFDMNADGKLNAIDLTLMKREILSAK